ncbi:uroporphyrinogen-III synthase [Pukyongiella litopenaei]|uniref:Uroporphyrinogen-III synthase n=1 Tax=Pukyongiella litopenaei TaxID=2605946 RepID=A0A2S0MN74_9RHOB|nr:uroporphyrinogen-III synthase [Pukyongiella litopenaei]AVO37191.1 uroporphyrinogen-III synthase [Pukyongiella litopenaei]
MTHPRPILLMTRPPAASDRFVADLPEPVRDRTDIVASPLIGIDPLPVTLSLAGVAGLLFTSANGVAASAALTGNRDLPAYCVGEVTAQAARDAGWDATCVGLDARELVAALTRSRPAAPLLHLRGVHASGDIAGDLTAAGLPTRAQAVYDQQLLAPTPEALGVLTGAVPVIAPLFSPRTARHFATLPATAPLHLLALSEAVAEPLRALEFRELLIAAQPDAASTAVLVETCVNRLARVEAEPGAQ